MFDTITISADVLKKSGLHKVAESISLSETAVKKAYLRLSELTVSLSEILGASKIAGGGAQLYQRAIDELLTVSDTLHYVLTTQQIVDALHLLTRKVIGEPIGDIAEVFVKAFKHPTTQVTDSMSISELLSAFLTQQTFQRFFSDVQTLGEAALVKMGFKKTSESVTPFSELTVKVKRQSRAVSEPAVNFGVDALKKRAVKAISELFLLTENVRKFAAHARTESLGAMVEALSKEALHRLSETAITAGDTTRKSSRKALADILAIPETLKKKALHKLIEATISITDFIPSKARQQFRAISESVGLISDTLASKAFKFRRLFDTLVITEARIIKRAWKKRSEIVFFSEAFVKHRRYLQFLSDVMTISEIPIGRFKKYVIKLKDIIGATGIAGPRRELGGKRKVSIHRRPDIGD